MADGHPPRVLVIDDDASVRQVLRFLLAAFGYESQPAADGPSGLAVFLKGGWDLVLTDLEMPEMTGWQVIEAVRQHDATMPIVASPSRSSNIQVGTRRKKAARHCGDGAATDRSRRTTRYGLYESTTTLTAHFLSGH